MRKLVTPNFGAVKDPALQAILRAMHANIAAIPDIPVVKSTGTAEKRYAPLQDYQRTTVTSYNTTLLEVDLRGDAGLTPFLPRCNTHDGSTTYGGDTDYCSGNGSIGYFTWNGTAIVWKDEIYAQPSQNQTWTKGQRGAYVALTSSSASIAVNLALSNNFSNTLTENTTLASPSNAVAGQSGVIHFTQGSGATYTLSKHTFWEFGIGSLHAMSTNLSGVSVMTYVIDPSGLSATCSWVNKS